MRKLLLLCIMSAALFAICLQGSAAPRKTKPSNSSANGTSTPAKLTAIYRCGNSYQPIPCDTESSARQQKLVFHDKLTVEQHRAAQQSARQLNKQADAIDKAQKKSLAALQRNPAKAIGLSCHVPGSEPFDTCNAKPASSKSKNSVKPIRKPHADRPKQGPFVSSAPDKT